jgi:hypothetical protein
MCTNGRRTGQSHISRRTMRLKMSLMFGNLVAVMTMVLMVLTIYIQNGASLWLHPVDLGHLNGATDET